MKRVFLDESQIGAVLAKTIYNSDGSILLAKGVELNNAYIKRLQELGILQAYVVHKQFQKYDLELKVDDLISDTVRQESIKIVKANLLKIVDSGELNYSQISNQLNSLINELLNNKSLICNLTDIRSFDNYTFGHSVNVAVLSVTLGIHLGLSMQELHVLGMGAFLHDIGKMILPIETLNKPGKLTDEEYALVQKHSEDGFNFIRQNKSFNIVSAHVAYQHHERYDGTGYPRSLSGNNIHQYARIAAVADVYDALVANRPYRRAWLPHKALEFINLDAGKAFDPEIVNIFLKCISPYPLGTVVQLNINEKGIVIRQNETNLARPILFIYEKKWHAFKRAC